MKSHQKEEGDALPKGFRSSLPQGIKVTAKVNHLQELKLLYNSLSLDEKDHFYKKFGKIANLLEVEIQEKALVVMLNYWDPSFRVFTFNDADSTPTVEEYAFMLNLSVTPQSPIYIPKLKGLALSNVADLLYITETTLAEKIIKKGDTQGWEAAYTLKNMSLIRELGNKIVFIYLLAFAIYALVLLPGACGMMDLRATDVFLVVLH